MWRYEQSVLVSVNPLPRFEPYAPEFDCHIQLAFAGHVVGEEKRYRPTNGVIITSDGKRHRVRLDGLYPKVRSILKGLPELAENDATSISKGWGEMPAVFQTEAT